MSWPIHSSNCSTLLFNAATCKCVSLPKVSPVIVVGVRLFQSRTFACAAARGVPGERSTSSLTDCEERNDGGGEEGTDGTEGATEFGTAVL